MRNKFITKEADLKGIPRRQQMEVKFKQASVAELKALGDDIPDGYIAGWASTPDMDFAGHVVAKGAFDLSVSRKGLLGPKGIKLLVQHDSGKPAGIIKVLETRGQGLWIEAQLNLKISYVRDIYEASLMNNGLSFSVGFFLEDFEFKMDEATKTEYLLINKAELEEVSVVTFPCNAEAGMTYIKSLPGDEKFDTIAELEKALVASGLVKSRNDAQRLTRVVKINRALFQATPPVKANTKALDDLAKVLADMKTLSS